MIRSSISTGGTLPGVEGLIADRTAAWEELVGLLGRANGRLDRLPGDDVLRLGDLYRSTTADLARARQRWPGDPVVGELDALVGRARAVVYRVPGRRASFGHWVTTGFFRRARERPGILLVAALLLWGPAIGAGIWAHGDPGTAGQVARVSPLSSGAADSAAQGGPGARSFSTGESASLGTEIFVNNIRVALLCLALGITGGLLTALLLAFNGALVGLIVGLFTASGAGGVAITYLAPHGVLELSLVTLAGAAGLRLGAALVAPGLRPRATALVEEARAAAEIALGVALWLVPTGLVEGFVTPQGLPPSLALAVGLVIAGAFWSLVWFRGRPPPAGDPSADPDGQSLAVALASR